MTDATRIEETYGLPQWVRRAAGSRLAAVAAAQYFLFNSSATVSISLRKAAFTCS